MRCRGCGATSTCFNCGARTPEPVSPYDVQELCKEINRLAAETHIAYLKSLGDAPGDGEDDPVSPENVSFSFRFVGQEVRWTISLGEGKTLFHGKSERECLEAAIAHGRAELAHWQKG